MDAKLPSPLERLARELGTQAGTIDDLNALFRGMMKSALECMLNVEMDAHLARKDQDPTLPFEPRADHDKTPKNRRNGHSKKTVQGEMGDIPLDIPRAPQAPFAPQLIAKYQRRLAGFDDKILTLYAKGLTARDIQDVVLDLYGVEVSPTLISDITADLEAEVNAFKTRRLDPVWPIVYLDGIVVHVRGDNGRVSQHTMYVALGVNLEGRKELLGLWLGENEVTPQKPWESRAAAQGWVCYTEEHEARVTAHS